MKKHLIAAAVGGIIIFLWQFLSFAALDLHRVEQQYTPKQDTIMSFLRSHLSEGKYFLPTLPEGASAEEQQRLNEQMNGKDWAIVDYHARFNSSMPLNMARGLLVNMLMIYLMVWILQRGGSRHSFTTIFLSTLFVGLISFLNSPYTNFIWYQSPGIWQEFMDAVVAWGATGLWLGWWLRR